MISLLSIALIEFSNSTSYLKDIFPEAMHGLANPSKKRTHDQIFTNDLVGKCRSAHDFYVLLTEQCKSGPASLS